MSFSKEADFEENLISLLSKKGWEKAVLKNYTEKQLIENWAHILFNNNRSVDRLNNYPLTDGEMQQIIEQIKLLKTPLKLNGFINGRSVTITRDNPDDRVHLGKEISLKIYDRLEIAAGESRYQIVQQPKFPTKSKILNDRRGDLMLLINGMPLIHIELKKSGIPVSQACHQIKKYAHEGIFTGLFSLVQIFVAMNPEETVYFANPGPEGHFNPDYYFHWADFNNEPINDWKRVTSTLLSIPMAHQLIGFYTVADNSDGVLKVMRSYQYFAANAISDKVAKTKWSEGNQLGGYIWHTTGSGKTMTSFKSAQLIAASKNADKVIFLMDRIELGTQSLKEYRGFADDNEDVQATENTNVLVTKLKSINPSDTLIVTSIQKMSNIKADADGLLKAVDIELMRAKRIVFILDECHRSTFGDMLLTIKHTFPQAIFFGFTGTPIQEENKKHLSTTSMVFGSELHRYSIADGIRDKNVLGFDPYMVLTYKDNDLKEAVALEKAKAKTVDEAVANPRKSAIFYKYMKLPMAGETDSAGNYQKGIEYYVPIDQYETSENKKIIIKDILDNWAMLSHANKFHAILATGSISEAIAYYRLIKKAAALKVTALFDPTIDNTGNACDKEEGLAEIIVDYNARYGQSFSIPTFAKMKKDIAARLAHKKPYKQIEATPDEEIDLLIVVDQMLTGFDSKWVNTLYLDKMLSYENIIQAFSRTNRLFGPEKPFGTIKYYRKPHTMHKYIDAAIKLYSGNKPLGLFADKLGQNLSNINNSFQQIDSLFHTFNIANFEKLPEEISARKKFAILFKQLNAYLEAAKIQGFNWKNAVYVCSGKTTKKESITVMLDERTYKILVQRYKELAKATDAAAKEKEVPFDIDSYITTIDTGTIDSDYMNSRFAKYIKALHDNAADNKIDAALDDLHSTFAELSQEEQKYANLFIHDIERGDVTLQPDKTFRNYITEYITKAKDEQIHTIVTAFGLDEKELRSMLGQHVTAANINEFGRYDALKTTVDKKTAKTYLEKREGKKIIPPKVNIKVDKILRNFIINDVFNLEDKNN